MIPPFTGNRTDANTHTATGYLTILLIPRACAYVSRLILPALQYTHVEGEPFFSKLPDPDPVCAWFPLSRNRTSENKTDTTTRPHKSTDRPDQKPATTSPTHITPNHDHTPVRLTSAPHCTLSGSRDSPSHRNKTESEQKQTGCRTPVTTQVLKPQNAHCYRQYADNHSHIFKRHAGPASSRKLHYV